MVSVLKEKNWKNVARDDENEFDTPGLEWFGCWGFEENKMEKKNQNSYGHIFVELVVNLMVVQA